MERRLWGRVGGSQEAKVLKSPEQGVLRTNRQGRDDQLSGFCLHFPTFLNNSLLLGHLKRFLKKCFLPWDTLSSLWESLLSRRTGLSPVTEAPSARGLQGPFMK